MTSNGKSHIKAFMTPKVPAYPPPMSTSPSKIVQESDLEELRFKWKQQVKLIEDTDVTIQQKQSQVLDLESKLKTLQQLVETATASPARKSQHRTTPSLSLRTSSFFGGTKKSLEVDMSQIEINELVNPMVSADLYSANVNGWRCLMKDIAVTDETRTKDAWDKQLENFETLPAHPNITRYLFHDWTVKGRLRVFTTWYSTTLRQLIDERLLKGLRSRKRLAQLRPPPRILVDSSSTSTTPPSLPPPFLHSNSFHTLSPQSQTNLSTSLGSSTGSDPTEDDPRSFELFKGEDLSRLLMDIVSGLEFLHSQSIIHRSLTTDNIYVARGEDGLPQRLVLGNFDDAKKLASNESATKTHHTKVTVAAYQAPELLNPKGGAYDMKTDVWSLGMVLYEMLTSKRPYEDVAVLMIPSLVITGKKPQVPVVFPEAYQPFIPVYEECTEYYADERPTFSTLKEHLIDCAAGKVPVIHDDPILANKRLSTRGGGAGGAGSTANSVAAKEKLDQIGFNVVHNAARSGSLFEKFIVVGLPLDWRVGDSSAPKVLFEYPRSEKPIAPELANFCFPNGIDTSRVGKKVAVMDVTEQIFSSLDRLEGPERSFTFMIFEKEQVVYGVCVHIDEVLQAAPSFFPHTAGSGIQNYMVAPRCYCFITRFPFFKLHFDVLYSLLARERLYNTQRFLSETPRGREQSKVFKDDTSNAVLQLLEAYRKTDVPKKCESLSFRLPGELRSIEFYCPPGNQDRFLSQWCIPILCRVLSLENILQLLFAALLERQMCFLSKYIGVVSHSAMAMLCLMRPYSWQGTFLPVLPSNIHECLEAPVPFILGVQTESVQQPPPQKLSPSDPPQSQQILISHSAAPLSVSDICVIANLDANVVHVPSAAPLPADIWRKKDLLNDLKGHYEVIRGNASEKSNATLPLFKVTQDQQKAVQNFMLVLRNWHSSFLDEIVSKIPPDGDFDFSSAANVKRLLKDISSRFRPFVAGFLQTQFFTMLASQLMIERKQIGADESLLERMDKKNATPIQGPAT